MKLLEKLSSLYNEPHRHYHNLDHIAFMFKMAKDKGIKLTRSQEIAIWFHDAVYVPGAKDNEDLSARLAQDHMNHLQDTDFLDVVMMIRDTKDHKPRFALSAVVCDLDMSILAAPWDVYQKYAANIRKEFAAVPDKEFYTGRQMFLLSQLMKNRIFHTNYFVFDDAAAVRNIEDELSRIKYKLERLE